MKNASMNMIKALARSLGGLAVVDTLRGDPRRPDGGLQRGDVILRVDGARVSTTSELVRAVSSRSSPRTVTVFRAGEELSIPLTRRASDRSSLVRLMFEMIAIRRR